MVEKRNRVIIYLVLILMLILLLFGAVAKWKIITSESTAAADLTSKGVNAYRGMSLDVAIISWKKALELEPDNLQLRYNLAQALDSTGAAEEAITEYQKIIDLDPRLASPRYNLAVLYRQQGKLDNALQHLDEAVRRAPYFVAGRLLRAEIYQQQGAWAGALAEYQAVIEMSRHSAIDLAELYFELGNVYYNLQLPVNSKQAWRKTLELQPDHSRAKASIVNLQTAE